MRWNRISPLSPVVLLAGMLLAGCTGGGRLPPVMPSGAVPASEAAADSFVRQFVPSQYHFHRFRWQFQDDRGAVGGRGSLHVAAPDSLRFDVAGALGSGKAAAFVVGDSAQWAEPEDDVRKLVPNYPLLWAMLGVPLPPAHGASVSRFADARVEAWRYVAGPDTIDYVLTRAAPRRLVADVRQAGKSLGRVTTDLGLDGAPLKSRLVVPSVPARLDITYYLSRTETGFAPDTWTLKP